MEYNDIKILIEGVELPAPSSMELQYEDLDADSIRSISDGVLERNRIRSNVQKVTLSYLLKDLVDIKTVYEMVSPSTFEVELRDDTQGKRVTKEMYAGPKSHSYIRTQSGIKGQAIKFSLIEV